MAIRKFALIEDEHESAYTPANSEVGDTLRIVEPWGHGRKREISIGTLVDMNIAVFDYMKILLAINVSQKFDRAKTSDSLHASDFGCEECIFVTKLIGNRVPVMTHGKILLCEIPSLHIDTHTVFVFTMIGR